MRGRAMEMVQIVDTLGNLCAEPILTALLAARKSTDPFLALPYLISGVSLTVHLLDS